MAFLFNSSLTLHGQDCHDTRYHACTWCVEYFDSADELHTHITSKHHFECSICHDVSPIAEDLEEHGRQKHGGLQPDEQELEIQRCREEKLEQSERRKEKAEEEAKQEKCFTCTECVKGFSTKRELDNHITDKHIFVCGECLKIFKVKAERDTHMEKDHKGLSTEMTKQEKLLAEEWHRRESREENDRRAMEKWQKVWSKFEAKKKQEEAGERKRARRSHSHSPRKRQNVLRVMTETRMKIITPQKTRATRAAWTHCMSQQRRSSEKPTRKATQ